MRRAQLRLLAATLFVVPACSPRRAERPPHASHPPVPRGTAWAGTSAQAAQATEVPSQDTANAVSRALATLAERPGDPEADRAHAYLLSVRQRQELVVPQLLLRLHRLVLDPPGLQSRRRDRASSSRADHARGRYVRLAQELGPDAVEAVEPLLLLEHARRHADVRAVGDIVSHLGEIHRFGLRAIPILERLLDSGVPSIRGLAAEALGTFGGEAAGAEDALVRNALAYDTPGELESTLLGLQRIGVRKQSHWDEFVRWAGEPDVGPRVKTALEAFLRQTPRR